LRNHAADDDEYEEAPAEQQQQQLEVDEVFRNTELTTYIWRAVSTGDIQGIQELINKNPLVVKVRAEDGRGPLFWAYEYKQPAIVKLLLANGADENAQDVAGSRPRELASV